MIEVKKEGVLVKKTELACESEGVLNPVAISDVNCIVIPGLHHVIFIIPK